jgi:copper(I)-binding protein
MNPRFSVKTIAILLLFLIQCLPVYAHSYKKDDILIGHAWGLPSQGARTQVFFPLTNDGSTPDKLLRVTTTAARQAMLVEPSKQTVPHFTLGVKAPVPMRPGARHILLDGLVKPLKHGDRIPLKLEFEHAGSVSVEVWIEPTPYAKPPASKVR